MLIMDNRGKSWLIGQVQSENPVLRSCFGSGFGSGVARQELPRLFELTDMGLTRMEFKEPPLFEKSRGTWRTMRKPRQRMDNQFIRDSDRVCFSISSTDSLTFLVWSLVHNWSYRPSFQFPLQFQLRPMCRRSPCWRWKPGHVTVQTGWSAWRKSWRRSSNTSRSTRLGSLVDRLWLSGLNA